MATFNPHSFSYSSLKQYETCPKQYAEITVYRNYKNEFTSSNGDYGDRAHKAAEAYVKDGGQLDNEFQFFKPVLDVLRTVPGQKLTEHKMGVTKDMTPVGWNHPDRWFQGIADLVIVGDSPVARVVDYKFGNANYADTDQLELMSLLVFAHYPHIKLVKGRLMFVISSQLRDRNVDISERDRIIQKWREKDAKRVASIIADNFPARSSACVRVIALCRHARIGAVWA
jgi:hypothetical protein